MKVPKTSNLDNLTTLTFKWANLYKQPFTYILNRPLQPDEDPSNLPVTHDYVFQSLEDVVRKHPTPSIKKLYDDLSYWISTDNLVTPLFYMFTKVYRDQLGLEEIKRQYDELMEHIGSSQTFTIEEMEDLYKYESEKYIQDQEQTINELNNMLEVQGYIEELGDLYFSPIEYTKRTLEAKISTGNYEAIDLFNLSKLSNNITYIRYHNSHQFKKNFFKIFENTDYQNYENRLIKFDTDHEGIMINIIARISDKDFTDVNFDFVSETFKATIPIYEKIPEILENIHRCFDNKIIMSNLVSSNMGGIFYVYDVNYANYYYLLLDEIMNNPIFNTYLYIEEQSNTSADRISFIIHYSSTNYDMSQDKADDFYVVGDLNATIRQKYGHKNEVYKIWTPKGYKEETFKKLTPYLEIVVTGAKNENMFYRFQYLISKLFYYFTNYSISSQKDSTQSFYVKNVPELKYINMEDDIEQSNLQKLKTKLPDAITTQYASKCQKKKQPVVIEDEDLAEWTSRTFIDNKGEVVNRSVLPFPPVDPKVNLGCPADKYPYPHGIKNTGENKDAYPYLPCCAGSQPRDEIQEAYYLWKPTEKTTRDVKGTYLIVNDKILDYERCGKAPVSVSRLLKMATNEENDVVRIGSVPSKSSLIHCALIATDNVEYRKLGTDAKRENFVQKYRQKLASKVNPAVVRQEMYSESDERIRQKIADFNEVFDSRLMFRIIEMVYDLSVFVFDLSHNTFELPNFKIFTVRPWEERKCLFILKHTQKRVDLEYPVYEIIGTTKDDCRNVTKILPKEVTKVIFDAYNYVNQNIIWMKMSKEIVPFNNVFASVNYQDILGNIKGQWIDSYGKARAFVFTHDNIDVGVVVPPTMPLYLPIITELPVISIDLAVELFGNPTHEDNVNGWIMGLWFKMIELNQAVYVPIEPINNSFYPIGRSNPIMVFKSQSELQHLQEMQKTLNMVLDIIVWIFTFELENNVYQRSYYDVTKKTIYYSYYDYASNFVRLYFRIINREEYYDLSKLVRKLPDATTTKDAIKQIHKYVPTLAGDSYIICYNEEFKNKIIGFLADFLKANEGRAIDNIRPKYINSMFQKISDFQIQDNVYIFDDYRQLKTWTDQLLYKRYNNVLTELKSHLTDLSPFIYRYEDENRMFMIQNTKTGFINEALELCRIWTDKHYNAGPSIVGPKDASDKYTHVKYRIFNGQIKFMSQYIHPDKEKDESAYEVLEVVNGKWAAMLPLK